MPAASPTNGSETMSSPMIPTSSLTTHHLVAALTSDASPPRRVFTTDTIPDIDDSGYSHANSDTDSEPDLYFHSAHAHATDLTLSNLVYSTNHLLTRPHVDGISRNTARFPLTPTPSFIFETYDSRLHTNRSPPTRAGTLGTLPGAGVTNGTWMAAPMVQTPGEIDLPTSMAAAASGRADSGSLAITGHPAHSHARVDPGSTLTARAQGGAFDEQNLHSHVRGLSLLDEDDQLATHLDASAMDALQDAGEEEEEDLRAERQRRRMASGSPSRTRRDQHAQPDQDAVQTQHRAEMAAAEGKIRGQAAFHAAGGQKDISSAAAHLASTTGEAQYAEKPGPARAGTESTVLSASTVDEDDAAFLAAVNQRLDPAAKLRALKEEFGPSRVRYSSATNDGAAEEAEEEEEEEEEYIASAMAVLFRTVLIRGTLVVTNHRLCFFATLPPPLGTASASQVTPGGSLPVAATSTDADVRMATFPLHSPSGSEAGAQQQQQQLATSPGIPTDPALSNPILIKGPAVLHRTGWRRKRRCWFELRADGFCAYPSSEQLYQPLGSIRLQDIEEVCPADFKRVTWLSVKVVGGKTASLEFGTEEACLVWRRELEAALWAYRNSSDKIRISIPLARIAGVERIGMLHFAIASSIRVFEYEPGTSKIPGVSDSSSVGKTRDIAFGMTKRNAVLVDKLLTQLQGPSKWRDELGFEEAMRRTPAPIVEVEGSRVQDEHDVDSSDEADKGSPTSVPSGRKSTESSPAAAVGTTQATASSVSIEKAPSKNSIKSAGMVGSSEGSHSKQLSNESAEEIAAKAKQVTRAQRFIDQFVLKARPEDITLYKADIVRTIPSAGTLAVSTHFLCFWRRRLGSLPDIRLKIPVSDLVGVSTSRAFRWHVWGLSLHIRGHADLPFEFHDHALRDRALEQIRTLIETSEKNRQNSKGEADVVADASTPNVAAGIQDAVVAKIATSGASEDSSSPLSATGSAASADAKAEDTGRMAQRAHETHVLMDDAVPEDVYLDKEVINYIPKMINVSTHLRRVAPMNIFCLTIGSRGDVQPYIALGKALQADGHRVTIVSHPEYEKWVRGHGIEYRPVGGDPGKLMQLSVEHRILSPSFFRESIGKFRDWLDELLRESWEQCQGAEVLIESPSTMSGIHVAEGLGIPYFRAFTMPWTPTSAYPQAFSVPPFEMGASYNMCSYALFDSIMWRATSGQINRWRKHMLGLKSTDLTQLEVNKVPFVYNFSEAVVPFPNDWGSRIAISGYWFLQTEQGEWDAPAELIAFLDKARKDGKKIVYIGFGSITVPDPVALTKNIYAAVKTADVRAIVSKGWSARMQKGKAKEEEPVPPECYVVDSIPHDWLFPRIDIAMHHGGAGTTGASLRAGLVTLIKPFFGDQYMWALRVQKLGAGARVSGLDASDLAEALKKAAEDRIMVEKAQEVGRKIRSEDGPAAAIAFIYQNLKVATRVRHERGEPSRSWTATLIRSDTTATATASQHAKSESTGVLSEQEEIFSDDGEDGGEHKAASRRHRSLKLVKAPFSSSSLTSSSKTGRSTASSSGTTLVKSPLALSDASTGPSTPTLDHGTLSESEAEGERIPAASPKKSSSSALSRLQTLPSLSMPSMPTLPTLPIPNVIKDLVGSESGSGVKSPSEASETGAAAADSDSAVAKNAEHKEAGKAEEHTAKKPPSRSYKALKAEDRRRAELMAERIKRELDKGVTLFEAQRIQAQQAAADSAERVRLLDEEAEKEAAKEKEKEERKARTKSSHVLPSFVSSGRKSLDLSGLFPSVGGSSSSTSASDAGSTSNAAANTSALTATKSADSGAVVAATAATAGMKPAEAGGSSTAERPAVPERRVTEGSKVCRRISLRGSRPSPKPAQDQTHSSSSATPTLESTAKKQRGGLLSPRVTPTVLPHSAPPTAMVLSAADSAPTTPGSLSPAPPSAPVPASGDSGTTLRPSAGPGPVQDIVEEVGVAGEGDETSSAAAAAKAPLGEPLKLVESPRPMDK
ncbi:hypothetical protein OC842_004774 [Tilletia horrida]|uniref:sterol 3beta-glucosyltransferase n=1 Tax=Tilletia horrida TaxID=155126 RepID=A0AAN6GAF2_9BASI|nr:hypothetical protein OC842_004774 [Tilletia horrida]